MLRTVEKYVNSASVIYLYFFIMLITLFSVNNTSFRAEDIPYILKILHPEYYNGGFFNIDLEKYNPIFNYYYFTAFLAKILGYKESLRELGRILSFLQSGLIVLALIKLCNYIFNNNKIVSAIAIAIFFSFLVNDSQPLYMALPFYLLATYYFLREKWVVSGLIGASLFYLHIGMAIWWFLPSCLALAIMYQVQKKVSFKNVINYIFSVIILASPMIYFYLGRTLSSSVDEFSIKYYYYTAWHDTSPLLTIMIRPIAFTMLWLIFVLFLFGYRQARESLCKTDNIMPLVTGAIVLYIVQFIFADILGSSFVITMQLLRPMLFISILEILFIAFLLANYIRKSKYLFFFVFLVLLFYYPESIAFIVFGFAILINELFECPILYSKGKTYKHLNRDYNCDHLNEGNAKKLLQHPVIIGSILLIMFTVPKLSILSSIKSYVKSTFQISRGITDSIENARSKDYKDVAKFINEKITDKKAVFLFPFNKIEFLAYSYHNSFINSETPIFNLAKNESSHKFRHILENDLGSSLEKLFKNWDGKNLYERWDNMWKNLSEDIIMRWKERYNLTHVIRENELPLNFAVIYKNSHFTVYSVR